MSALIFLSALLTWLTTITAGYGLGKELKGIAVDLPLLLSILLMTLTLWLAMSFN